MNKTVSNVLAIIIGFQSFTFSGGIANAQTNEAEVKEFQSQDFLKVAQELSANLIELRRNAEVARNAVVRAEDDCRIKCKPESLKAMVEGLLLVSTATAVGVTVYSGIISAGKHDTGTRQQAMLATKFFTKPWKTVSGRIILLTSAIAIVTSVIDNGLDGSDELYIARISDARKHLESLESEITILTEQIQHVSAALSQSELLRAKLEQESR